MAKKKVPQPVPFPTCSFCNTQLLQGYYSSVQFTAEPGVFHPLCPPCATDLHARLRNGQEHNRMAAAKAARMHVIVDVDKETP